MRKEQKREEQIRALLQENAIAHTSAEFSDQLKMMLEQQCRHHHIPPISFNAGKWLGKAVMSLLVSFNLLLLVYLGSHFLPPAIFISLSGFVLGVWGIIGMMKKIAMHQVEPAPPAL